MTIKSVFIKNSDFEKCLKTIGKKKSEKLLEKMKELEKMENDHSLVPEGKKSAENTFGKRLNVNKNTYVLELGFDRAMALVVEKDNKKIFVWFWCGSHEEYNKKLKAQNLNKNENTILNNQMEEINEGISEIKARNREEVLCCIKEGRKDRNNKKAVYK